MKLYNTLSKTVEDFVPNGEVVSLYTCGPTVYDNAHIGNLRTYIFEDLLRRSLVLDGYKVKHVMNITDVDDKTIKKGKANKVEHAAVVKHYEQEFVNDLKALNILEPDKITRATQYIPEMVQLIKSLLDKGYAYRAADNSIYFSIEKFSDYGKLSNLDKTGLKSGARVAQDEYDKENPADFALWKAWDPSDGEIFWETELGKGRPGWHIECSAMSQSELGDCIDIHAGGVDLIFPHHENEIAQSEASTGKQFAKYWSHAEHLLVDGQKMSKSLGNFYTLADIVAKGFEPLDFRYLCLQSHYRSKLNFTLDGMSGAKNARFRMRKIVGRMLEQCPDYSSRPTSKEAQKVLSSIFSEFLDDLNSPQAFALIWDALRSDTLDLVSKLQVIEQVDLKITALDIFDVEASNIPADISSLIKKRQEAKAGKDFQLADLIRAEIEERGYRVEDSAAGTKVVKK